MINNITILKEILIPKIKGVGLKIDRIKETTSDQSIYIYTNKGVIRISDHHNQKSFEKCIVSIVVPVKSEIAIKMIQLLKPNNN